MIKINSDIDLIVKEYVRRIMLSFSKNRTGRDAFFNDTALQKRIWKMYECKADQLKCEHKKFVEFLEKGKYPKKNIETSYFDYEQVLGYKENNQSHSYWLMEKLDVPVCPYCNRIYTSIISNSRPPFDHFYPKSKYKFLSLSVYNLIPCCAVCNTNKLDKGIAINPYLRDFGNKCKFMIDKLENVELDKDKKKWKIIFHSYSKRYQSNIEKFKLDEFYQWHKDYVLEIFFKARAYNEDYYRSLIDDFGLKNALNEREMKLLIFGNYTEHKELGKRPLAKLTKDIIEQIGIDA